MVRDVPRFGWRGAMLDVARHFFPVEAVTRYLDLIAYYKMNVLHLHLTDDQGWRIAISGWPELTTHGGSTEVGGGPGGFYTEEDYTAIVEHARRLHITVVPEVDMPGHVNAALSSYGDLTCDGVAPELFTSIGGTDGALCVGKTQVQTFVTDVLSTLARLTPGPYLHVGGDEASQVSSDDYVTFEGFVQDAVQGTGKRLVGWEEVANLPSLSPTALAQHWNLGDSLAPAAVQAGAQVIMSPADHAYLDQKYDASSRIGLSWAGFVDEQKAYEWDPAEVVSGVGEADIAGVEAPLWTETVVTTDDMDYLAFPRLIGHAEIGWSPKAGRGWDEYRVRLASHAARLDALGVKFHRSGLIPWP
jgi:hexosaminidase